MSSVKVARPLSGRAWSLLSLCVNEFEIRRGRTDPDPQPVLQGVRADEHGIGRCEEVMSLPLAGTLPFQFHPVDENEPSR